MGGKGEWVGGSWKGRASGIGVGRGWEGVGREWYGVERV